MIATSVGRESLIRRLLFGFAVLGLAVGFLVQPIGPAAISPRIVWSIATSPVLILLAWSILRDMWAGRLGVDVIALVSMSAAMAIGQALAAVIVAIMYAGGSLLEDFARARSKRDLTLLSARAPRLAHRILGNAIETVPVDAVAIGDRLTVLAGEILPVDGVLIDQQALLDESALTGEPLPELRQPGEALRSGIVNAGDPFTMKATATASQSTYAGILRLVESAQLSKAPLLRLADRAAILMLPLTLVLAALAWWVSSDPQRAVAVLVVATPCPLILAAPVAFIGGMSRAAREGVVIKGGGVIEALASVRTAIFDKTGTLTKGGADLLEIEAAPGREAAEMLRMLASIEQSSGHVLARAVVDRARRDGLALSAPERVQETRGSGLTGKVDGHGVRAGSLSYVLQGGSLPVWAAPGEGRYRGEPVLRIGLSIAQSLAAVFTFGDPIRQETPWVLDQLRELGLTRIIMLTGDDEPAARRVAKTLRFDEVITEADPAAKVAKVERESAQKPTLMVGDGINDAPSLAAATVGVALGSRGATASSEASDVVILSDRLRPLVSAISIARRTRAIAGQSVFVGLGLSSAAMLAAASGMLDPVGGALLQEAIDIGVIINALRALGPTEDARSRVLLAPASRQSNFKPATDDYLAGELQGVDILPTRGSRN